MMAPFETLPGVRETFELASAALGIDLWAMVRDGPAEELEKTVNTQPVMLAAVSLCGAPGRIWAAQIRS
jgi:[acyl-carrier-protein] S-malonyltransferase